MYVYVCNRFEIFRWNTRKRGDENLGAREKYFDTWIIGLGRLNGQWRDRNKGLIFNVDNTRVKRRIVKWTNEKRKKNIFKIRKDRFVRNLLKFERCQKQCIKMKGKCINVDVKMSCSWDDKACFKHTGFCANVKWRNLRLSRFFFFWHQRQFNLNYGIKFTGAKNIQQ